jgi:hypothetical protein
MADAKSLRAAGLKYAYVRYFKMNQLGVSFQLRFDLLGKVADTTNAVSLDHIQPASIFDSSPNYYS